MLEKATPAWQRGNAPGDPETEPVSISDAGTCPLIRTNVEKIESWFEENGLNTGRC
jgi:hypothetical protein